MRRWLAALAGASACNWAYGIDRTELAPAADGTRPDGDPRVDLDRDGIKDLDDPCIAPDVDLLVDSDGDGMTNGVDPCPFDIRATGDADLDGIGDNCDPDPTAGDRVRCIMAFTDPELDVQMWRVRDNPMSWVIYYPRVLSAQAAGSLVADWPFGGPGITTFDASGVVFSATHHFTLLARAGLEPTTDVGCELVAGANEWLVTASGGASASLGPPPGQFALRYWMQVTLDPEASGGATLRCRARIEAGPVGTAESAVPLPVGNLGFVTDGYASVFGIGVYERDRAPQ